MIASDHIAQVRKHFAAAPERIFAAFADAELVARWLKPSSEIALIVLRFDFRVSGLYRFAYHLPEGPPVIIGGTFLTIEHPSKIVFSWIIEPPDEHAGIESEVTVLITPDDGGAELLIRHEKLQRSDAVARHAGGWQGAVDLLARLIETRGGVR